MRRPVLALMLVAVGSVVPSRAVDETGRAVLDRRRALDEDERRWTDRQGLLTVTLRDAEAHEEVREVMVYERRRPGGETRTVAFVRAPAGLAGTAFLQVVRSGGATEQWLSEPARPAPRRLGAEERRAPVLGTELTFQDLDVLARMLGWTDADARASLRGQEAVEGVGAHAIELWPKRPDAGYRKVVVWLGRDDLVTREVQLYGDRDVPSKRLRVTRVRDEGSVPWGERIEIDAPGGKGLATVEVSKVVFNRKVEAALFEPDALSRGGP